MIAYFLGGSWDLTKRQMEHCPPVLEIATWPRGPLAAAPCADDFESMGELMRRREFYVRARHDHENEIAIYIFEERP